MQKPRDRGACGAFRRARHFQFFEPIASPKTLIQVDEKKPQEANLMGRVGDAYFYVKTPRYRFGSMKEIADFLSSFSRARWLGWLGLRCLFLIFSILV